MVVRSGAGGLISFLAIACLFSFAALGREDVLFGESLAGEDRIVIARAEDSLYSLARLHGLGFVELAAANPGVDVWMPEPGTPIHLPYRTIVPRFDGASIIVNRAERRIFVRNEAGGIWNAPVTLGRDGFTTPLGRIAISERRRDPVWYPTLAHRLEDPDLPEAVPSGPDNPLGRMALRLGATPYLIHGTNQPGASGRAASRGCIRLEPGDADRLYDFARPGMIVEIIDAPLKLAILEGTIWLEIAPSPDWMRAVEEGREPPRDPMTDIETRLSGMAGMAESVLDWPRIRRMARERRGVPEPVGKRIERPAAPEIISGRRD